MQLLLGGGRSDAAGLVDVLLLATDRWGQGLQGRAAAPTGRRLGSDGEAFPVLLEDLRVRRIVERWDHEAFLGPVFLRGILPVVGEAGSALIQQARLLCQP